MRRTAAVATLLALAACGGGGGGGAPPPPPPPPANQAPSFTSAAAGSVIENRIDAYQAAASDPEGNAVTFSITGGADAALFTLSSAGLLRFVAPPDFELPGDSDRNNVYLVEITASDGQASRVLPVQLTVADESIAVRRVAAGLNQPLYVAPITGDQRVFVLEKGGNIYLLDPLTGIRTFFMSAAEHIDPTTGATLFDNISTDGERGLLGMAVQPNFKGSRQFVLFVTNGDGDIEIRLCRDVAGSSSARLCRVMLTIEHSQFNNHNGGWMGFGPDDNLYIAVGDGGGAGDPQGNAQNKNSLLGKILRITVGNLFTAAPLYTPTFDNPFIGGGGAPEVFAYGLRNPFRNSFSGSSLLIADVGQDAVEEIDVMPIASPGLNFGWPFREGTHPFAGTAPAGLTDPVSEYLHGSGPKQGNTIIGGYVYRGPVLALRDRYFFADFISRNIWTVPADLLTAGPAVPATRYERRNDDLQPDAGRIDQPVSFGEDSAGNLYIVDFDGDIFLVTGP
jgi:glucose/arabinose dehydrogenase